MLTVQFREALAALRGKFSAAPKIQQAKVINGISRYVVLPLIILLITIYYLGLIIEYALGTLIITILSSYMVPKSKS